MENKLINRRDAFSALHPETYHDINDRKWGALQVGNTGPALLLLPGTLGRGDIFWNQIEALSSKARILALSYPDNGLITEWTDDICAFLDVYSMKNASVLGSSLGGYVAQYFAATHPEKTDNLIAANTLSSVEILSQIPPYSADLDAMGLEELKAGFAGGLLQWAKDEPYRADLGELLLSEVSGRIPEQELRARLKALKFGPNLPAQQINKSQIFTVESHDDRLIPKPMRDAVRASLNPVKSHYFDKGSHFPYITHPNEYSEMLAEILGV